MKINFIKIFSIITLVAIFFSCAKIDSDDLDPEIPFYQDYKVIFKKHEGITKAKATFRVKNSDGVRIELESPAKILCNNQTSSFSNIENYFYHWEFSGITDVYYILTDNKSRVFNNYILFSDAMDISFPETFNVVKLDGTTTLTWEGEPLQENEFIYGMIVQDDRYSDQFFINEPVGATSINLPADYMTNLLPGEAVFNLYREYTIYTVLEEDESAGGRRVTLVETAKTITIE